MTRDNVKRWASLKKKRNAILEPALASTRFGIQPTAAAALVPGFLQDLIAKGPLPRHIYFGSDKNKLKRAAIGPDLGKHQGSMITGLNYDGRKDKAMQGDNA